MASRNPRVPTTSPAPALDEAEHTAPADAAAAPPPADTPDPSDVARTRRKRTIEEALSKILTTLCVDPARKETVLSGMARRWGPNLGKAARTIADLIDLQPQLFTGFKPGSYYRKLEDRILELAGARGKILGLVDDIADEEYADSNELAAFISDATDQAKGWLLLKGLDPDVRNKVDTCLKEIQGLLKKQNKTISEAGGKTRGLKQQIKSAETEVDKLKLENKYLSGDKLRPDDLGPDPQKPPRRKGKR